MPPIEVFEAYRANRAEGVDTSVLCHAPFVSLNFARNGTVTTCCYNRQAVLGTYPTDDLAAIWDGANARAFRDIFLQDKTAAGCELCFHQLRSGNFGGVLMRNFDRFSKTAGYRPELGMAAPQVLEFEIANTCNLECVMCDGEWSSSIRANREGLPPLHSPYDLAFVEQLTPYLPSIRAARFLGGEPFLISRYYDIWERLVAVNPDADLTITTNGTRLPSRARTLLEGLRANIVVSLDSLDPATFERIRPGARFDEVMAHIEFFADYVTRRGTELALAVCPMQSNWRGLPDLMRFAADRGLWIHFNTVTRPHEASLATLPADALGDVVACLERARPEGNGEWRTQHHLRAWDGLVSQLRTWHMLKAESAHRSRRFERQVRARMAEAGAFATTETGERAVSFVVRSFCVGQNLAALDDEPIELARLLAGVPDLSEAAEPIGTMDLLLALHWLQGIVDGMRDTSRTATLGPTALDFARCIEILETNGAVADPLGRWLKERMRRGHWERTVRWLRAVQDIAQHEACWCKALEDGLDGLRARGLSDEECRTVGAYLERIVPFAPLPWPIDRPSPLRDDDVSLRRGEIELARMFDAMALFYRGSRPAADQDAFRRRLESTLAAVRESGLEHAVALSLAKVDPLTAFYSLADARDDELAGLVAQARAMLPR